MGFFSSIKRLWSSNKTAETPETPQAPAEEAPRPFRTDARRTSPGPPGRGHRNTLPQLPQRRGPGRRQDWPRSQRKRKTAHLTKNLPFLTRHNLLWRLWKNCRKRQPQSSNRPIWKWISSLPDNLLNRTGKLPHLRLPPNLPLSPTPRRNLPDGAIPCCLPSGKPNRACPCGCPSLWKISDPTHARATNSGSVSASF